MDAPVIETHKLEKSYGDFAALRGLDLRLEKGACLGLLGSNGAGKSTTLRILIGQLRPTRGTARVLGLDPTTEAKRVHERIGYIPDNQCLYDELTVEQNIRIFAELHQATLPMVQEMIGRVALTEKARTKVKDLSRGLKQRVLLARALVHRPSLVILDEPTSGLDPHSAEDMYKILEELKQEGTSILLTTHLMNDVARLCDQIVFIDKGQKVEEGSPQELIRKHSEPRVQIVLEREGHPVVESWPQDGELAQRLSQIPRTDRLVSIHSHEISLEEIFIKLVGREVS